MFDPSPVQPPKAAESIDFPKSTGINYGNRATGMFLPLSCRAVINPMKNVGCDKFIVKMGSKYNKSTGNL